MERRLLASLTLGAAALLGTAAAHAAPQYGSDGYARNGQMIRCESNDGRYRECRMDTRGRVQVVRQLSKTRCEEGSTWGQTRDGVWVNRGCRAEFASGRGGWNGGSSGQRIRCESDNGRTRTCAISTRGDVRLVRQLSSARCVEGRSWGQDRNGIWVSQGCRAEFEVQGRGNGWGGGGWNNGGGYGQVFRCESDRDRTRVCDVQGRGGVQLVRQLSSAPCIEGRTWGRDGRGVWVTAGCRAEFRSR
ncbi:DUF3011 domain-containing protein [Pseudoxanthomonas sp. SE1]|uniref:DUF3011 domain-containing protein n=1 Tax=Pseudoxanthomonas sp. SE1 TaxID=1664560 RepID=UPI00240E3403|nr:DUF3011 domain-containing protein [Pseudoxanthomonas sp. SE1]WFC40491.1 DUF3011 domain-containing protein [Pseudoxanthomonas sp. SE1]